MKFGENLKNFRKNNKLSQEELADKVGVTRQSVSKWELGGAYPEMSNIIALCTLFHCNINDLINDNIVDVNSFDKDTQEGIVKFKKQQQKRMKKISKIIYIISNILKIIIFAYVIFIAFIALAFPFVAKTFSINENKITLLNKEYNYTINNHSINIDNKDIYIETKSDIEAFINNHDNTFFRISIEYILICLIISSLFTGLTFNYLSKLFKNIYYGPTPFTLDNEKLVIKAIMFIFVGAIITKITALIYMFIGHIDLNIELSIKDLLILFIGISVIYIFKYGRMLQADTKAKIYD